MGPGAGIHGGEIVAQGTPEDIMANPELPSPASICPAKKKIEVPAKRRALAGKKKMLEIIGATGNNLKNVTAEFPLGLHLRHRRVRRRQVHASPSRRSTRPPRGEAERRHRSPGAPRDHRGHRAHRQGHRHRPVADRAHAALQPGDLHRRVRSIRDWFAGLRKPRRAAMAPAASPST
jgi:hypothetical protein